MKPSGRQASTFRACVVLVIVTCCLASTGVATAKGQLLPATPCSVGGAPERVSYPISLAFQPRPSHPPQVIACGTSFVGPFEIVAYPTVEHEWLCTLFLGEPFGNSDCEPPIPPFPNGAGELRMFQIGWAGGNGSSYTYLSGNVGTAVTRIEVRYHRYKKKLISRVSATVAQVNGDLLWSLHQTVPFARFAAVLPGCAVPQGMRLVAFDSEGARVGSQRGHKSRFGNPCRPLNSSESFAYAPATNQRR
jgi:hypothetical protein